MTPNRPSQNEHFTIKGRWWLPNSDRKVAGELDYYEESISLSLYGGFGDATAESPFSAKPDESKFAIIHGESEDNSPVTVLNSFYVKWKPDITTLAVRPGTTVALRASQLHCGAMVEGVHLSSANETFSKCRVEVPYLDVWLGVSPFVIDMSDPFRSIRLDYSLPATEDFELNASQYRVRFIHAVTPPALPFGPSPAIVHHTYLEIEPFTPQPFNRLLARSSEIVDLLAVVYGGPILSRRVTLLHPSHEQEPISLFYPRHKVKAKIYDTHDFLLRYENIKTSFQAILSNWLNANVNLKRAWRMLLSSERRPSKFIELRFLPLAHAAEVLSNEAVQRTMIAPAEFKRIRDRMLASVKDEIPPELTNSIKNSLQWANGRSLREKLRSLLSELQEDTCRLFAVDKEYFIAGVVNTRNHYTHYATAEGKKVLQGVELHWAIQKVALMLRILLLVRAGVSEQELQARIRSHIRFAQERSVWREISEEGSEFQSADGE